MARDGQGRVARHVAPTAYGVRSAVMGAGPP